MKISLAGHLIALLLSGPAGACAADDAARIVEQQRIVAAVKAARAQLAHDTQPGHPQPGWHARGRAHRIR